ncbi:alpha-keto acid decarboxylase family protein [Synechococcus sp. RSCCF101]|uniref:thiamine pyrophosphate-binding protein n=1 Tax=Synechococcus sp. RSCCF101 TaxID=2511069 RepID=UPI0012461481|nr:thiamine pyrophosphate-binding protein [Synechococcus sp. RSCCF101]QEY32718.1 alpha-keto acid decarboxylase family protein [Synechococcus sp. RSCCF101]
MTIIEALIDALLQRRVSHVYGVPGDYALALCDQLERSPIALINSAGEEGAGFAADVHARLTGFGVVVVTYGVGALKLLNPVAGAFVERSPVLVISGAPGVRESDAHALLHHRIRAVETQQRLFSEITAATACLDSGRTAAAELQRVLAAMERESRPGYLEIPRDCLDREIPWQLEGFTAAAPRPLIPAALQQRGEAVLRWLRQRRRVVVLAGVEVARLGLEQRLLELIEREGWLVATSLSGKSLLPEGHPLHLGVYEGAMSARATREVVEGSDAVLLLGLPLSDLDTGIFTMDLSGPDRVQVDLARGLIWPGGQEDGLDPAMALRIWLQAAGDAPSDAEAPARKDPDTTSGRAAAAPPFQPDADAPIRVRRLMAALDATLSPRDIVLADPGDALFASAELHLQEANSYLSSGFWASLGFALPGAVGAWGARPDRRPLVLLGDGALLMSGLELATLARYGIPALVVVLDNGGYGTERPMLDGAFNDVQRVDHVALALSLGLLEARRVSREDELIDALQHWQAERSGPVLLSVELPADDASEALQRLTAALAQRVSSRREAPPHTDPSSCDREDRSSPDR